MKNCASILIIICMFFVIKLIKITSAYDEKQFLELDLEKDDMNAAKCVLKLSAKYLIDKKALRGNIVIVNIDTYSSTSSQSVLKTLHHGKKYSIMVKDSAFPHKNASHFPEKAKNYMMILEHKEELMRNINQLKALPTWNPLAKAVIYIKKRTEYTVDTLVKELIDELKQHQLLRVVILVDVDEIDEIQAYYCKPYSKTSCLGSCDTINLLDICTSRKVINISEYGDIIPYNMEMCPLTVYAAISEPYVLPPHGKINLSIYDDQYNFTSGVEIRLLKLITDITNMSLVVRMMENYEERGELLPDGNATGLYEKVRYNIVDMIIGNLEVNKDIRKWLDSTSTYTQDEITWCVQKAGATSTWSNLLTIFTLSTWLTTIAAITFVACLFHWFLCQEDPKKSIWPTRSLMTSFGMVLGLVMAFNPKNTSFRIVMITWLLFSLNLNTSYQSLLRSFLIHPKYAEQIHSEAQLVASSLKLGGKSWIRETFRENLNIYGKFKVCDSFHECAKQISTDTKFAIAVPNQQIQYQEKLIGNGESFLYCFDENNIIYKYGVVLLTRKYYPLLDRFNRIIKSVNENGLIGKWTREAMPRDIGKTKNEMFPLGMNHMLGAFYMLLIGHGICAVILVLEITCHKIELFLQDRQDSKLIDFTL